MRREFLCWAGILIGLVAGVGLLSAGTQANKLAAVDEEIQRGDQALAAGAASEAVLHYGAAREAGGADGALVTLKLCEAYYALAEAYYREWATLSGVTAPSVVYDMEKAYSDAVVQANPAVMANCEAAMRNYDRVIEEGKKIERFPDEDACWWKAQYLLGNSYLRGLLMVSKSPVDPRGTKVRRLFRECVQSYKNALASRPAHMTEADKVWETYIKQNLELALALERGFAASLEAQESEVVNWSDAEEPGERQQSPLKLLSPAEKQRLERGGRVGVGELGGEK